MFCEVQYIKWFLDERRNQMRVAENGEKGEKYPNEPTKFLKMRLMENYKKYVIEAKDVWARVRYFLLLVFTVTQIRNNSNEYLKLYSNGGLYM